MSKSQIGEKIGDVIVTSNVMTSSSFWGMTTTKKVEGLCYFFVYISIKLKFGVGVNSGPLSSDLSLKT